MKTDTSKQEKSSTTAKNGDFDYSKAEELTKNVTIPNSQFMAKWVKDEGWAIGIENIKVTRSYETLEKALNQIGYGVDKDEEGDEVLVKMGEVDWELIVRIVKALRIIEDQNNEILTEVNQN